MLRWIVGSSLKFRYLVVALAAALMFFGVQQLQSTAVDVFPEFAPPKVEVQTPALGLSANQVENLVTIPLEQTLNGVPGLDEIRSKSVESLSSIEQRTNRRMIVHRCRLFWCEPSRPTMIDRTTHGTTCAH